MSTFEIVYIVISIMIMMTTFISIIVAILLELFKANKK